MKFSGVLENGSFGCPHQLSVSFLQFSNCRTFHLILECVLSCFGRVQLCATTWTVACQTPLSMEISRQEYWSGLLFPSRGDLPDPGIEPRSRALQADSIPSEPPGKPQNFASLTLGRQCRRRLKLLQSTSFSILGWQAT